MRESHRLFIDGQWVDPSDTTTFEVINPATEQPAGRITLGDASDVDKAVEAATRAFPGYSMLGVGERLELMDSIIDHYQRRRAEIAEAMTEEMGVNTTLSHGLQVEMGVAHFRVARDLLAGFEFESRMGSTLIRREPVGVCGFITPWNWPMNQIGCKAAPAIATGCTSVWKPSELAPFSATIMTEIFEQAGVPDGVINMVHGDGPTVGAALSSHPGIDMISFTGSTRAGVEVARAAAPTVKRVSQELGGKSANILLDDLSPEDFSQAVVGGLQTLCMNSGQNCNAPSRMLVPAHRMDEAAQAAREATVNLRGGDPRDESTDYGPVVSARQFDRIQRLIRNAIDQGAELVAGGPGRIEGQDRGFFVPATVFARVTPDMELAREEVFGPVLAILAYEDEDDAVRLANDSEYGLSGYVSGADPERVRAVARRMRTGMVHLNGSPGDMNAPFGGYRQSGNGREWGEWGLEEFLEVKAMMGGG